MNYIKHSENYWLLISEFSGNLYDHVYIKVELNSDCEVLQYFHDLEVSDAEKCDIY